MSNMINNSAPRIFVGAPATQLDPKVGTLKPNPSPIAIEITNGIGIGIDGESIVVGHGAKGEIEIIGHTEDGFYPQRDFKVTREDNQTKVDGFYNWQDQLIVKNGDKTVIKGETPRETYEVLEQQSGIKVSGQYPVQNYEIRKNGNETEVDGYDLNGIYDYKVKTEGNVTQVINEHEELSMKMVRGENSLKVDGKYAFQDFDITWDKSQIKIKGFYPQQNITIKFK